MNENVTVSRKDLVLLIKLAEVVLDSDDVKAYCRGLNTTPKKLDTVLDRCCKQLVVPLVVGAEVVRR